MVTWLDVPFDDNDKVKALGAKFSASEKRWFVPDGVDITPFKQWLPKPETRKDKAERFREKNLAESQTVEWQRKAAHIRTRDNYTCQHCKRSTGMLLQVHHRYYVDDENRRYWDYPDKALISLCKECHNREEEALFDAKRVMQRAIGWRHGEAKHMLLLAEALDKASDRHSIDDIIWAINHLIRREDILDTIIEVRRKDDKPVPPSGTGPSKKK